jgi:uncharacterized protein YoaH (UPF0181 family)
MSRKCFKVLSSEQHESWEKAVERIAELLGSRLRVR